MSLTIVSKLEIPIHLKVMPPSNLASRSPLTINPGFNYGVDSNFWTVWTAQNFDSSLLVDKTLTVYGRT